jgi:hypothetical protein
MEEWASIDPTCYAHAVDGVFKGNMDWSSTPIINVSALGTGKHFSARFIPFPP